MPRSSAAKGRRPKAKKPSTNGRPPKEVRLCDILPSPENDQLYRPVSADDEEIRALAKSIREHGVLEPLIITTDNYIVSGHRRYAAAKVAGLETVPVRRLPIRRTDNLDAFVQLLREHNRQRDKTNAERLREELVSVNPEAAYQELWQYRRETAVLKVAALKVGHGPLRKEISAAKQPMLDAVEEIIYERKKFWPLSDRQIHYALLNDPPLIHAKKPDSTYKNNMPSYKSLVDLLTRARLDGTIPFEAIGDETRPVQLWPVHQTVRSFVRQEVNSMFRNYWRDLMQSQPNHIELIVEKNTAKPIIEPIAREYTIPMTTGRGYCSLPPRHAMAERFENSDKEQLVLLIVSDFDPEGEDIAHSFARSMRDDFNVYNIHPIKVALTAQQVKQHKLPPGMQAKATSSRYKKFVRQHGSNVFELEALAPETLQQIVRSAIEGVIDRAAFDSEIGAERKDAAFLAGVRQRVGETLKSTDLEGDDDDD